MTEEIFEEKKQRAVNRINDALSRLLPLCPDHRDKQRNKPCLACRIEELERINRRLNDTLDTVNLSRRIEIGRLEDIIKRLEEKLESAGIEF